MRKGSRRPRLHSLVDHVDKKVLLLQVAEAQRLAAEWKPEPYSWMDLFDADEDSGRAPDTEVSEDEFGTLIFVLFTTGLIIIVILVAFGTWT